MEKDKPKVRQFQDFHKGGIANHCFDLLDSRLSSLPAIILAGWVVELLFFFNDFTI